MATPQDPIQLNVFNPPRPYLNDDSVFPQGTLVTKSDDDDLQTIFIKQEGGSYIVEASADPDLVMSTEPFYATHFYTGSIATIFHPVTGALVAEYVKQPHDAWKLASPTDTAAVLDGDRRIEVLPQVKYSAQQPPDVPVIKYEGRLLSDILHDKGASVADANGAAYDGKAVTSKKLSLRLLFPKIKYEPDHRQFTARSGNDGKVISRGKLAAYIAEELRTALAKAAQEDKYLHQADGTRVEFDRLVLIDVAFPSKASIQPMIGVICAE